MSNTDSNEQAHRGTWRRLRIGFALKAVAADPRAGLLLPWNVVLFESDDGGAVLGIIDPVQQLNAPSGRLAELAHEMGTRLTRVGQSLDSMEPLGGIG